jgi:hypothetical protein
MHSAVPQRKVRAEGIPHLPPSRAVRGSYEGLAFRLAKRRRLALRPELTDFDIIAREIKGYRTRFEAIEKRLNEVEKMNARLEDAALTTARALQEIAAHWDAVYEAIRPKDSSQLVRDS